MRLINSIEDLQKHVNISKNFDWPRMQPHCARAERKFIQSVIGLEQYEIIAEHALSEENTTLDQVKLLLQEAAAAYAMVIALPLINSSVTNSGVKSNKTEQTDNAQWYEVRDIIRNYYSTATEAVDAALEIMEANLAGFPKWGNSECYTVFKDLLVRHTKQFNSVFFINNNRATFQALQPYMREVEDQFVRPLLGECYQLLSEVSTDPIIMKAGELARKAIVCLTVAKVSVTGTFAFTPSGMTVIVADMPWQKTKDSLSEAQLENLRADRQNSGEEYLKVLKGHILTNAQKFPCFQEKESAGISSKIIKKKSHLSL